MALQKQKIQIPMTMGINDKISALVKDSTILEVLENVDLKTIGEIKKRFGGVLYETESNTNRLADYDEELLILKLTELLGVLSDGTKRSLGVINASYVAEKKAVSAYSETPLNAYSANDSGLTFIALINDNSSLEGRFSVYDDVTERFIVKDIKYDSRFVVNNRIVADSNNFFIAFIETQTPTLNLLKFDRTGSEVANNLSIKTVDLSISGPFDMIELNNNLYVVNKDSGNILVARHNKSTLAQSSAETVATTGVVTHATLLTDGTNIYSIWIEDTSAGNWNIKLRKYDETLALLATLTVADSSLDLSRLNLMAVHDSTNAKINIYIDGHNTATSLDTGILYYRYDIAGNTADTVSNSAIQMPGSLLASKGRFVDGAVQFLIKTKDINQGENTLFLVSHVSSGSTVLKDTFTPISAYENQVVGNNSSDVNYLFSLDSVGFTSLSREFQTDSVSGVPNFNSSFKRFEFITDFDIDYQVFKNLFFFTGNYLHIYDGINVCENNFLHAPFLYQAPAKFTSSGGFSDGILLVKMIYRWVDNLGNVHQSNPSVTETITFSGGGSAQRVSIEVFPYFLGKIPLQKIELVVYRTELDGTILYRDASASFGLVNSISAIPSSVSILIDNLTPTDAELIDNEPIYTNGGIDGNRAVYGCRYVTGFDDRLCVMGGSYLDKVIYSKPSDINFYNLDVSVDVPKGNGDPNGFISMDSRLVVFKENKKYTIFGTGADVFGSGNFQPASELPSEQGLESFKSLVLTSMGIFFKSSEGIFLLDRGFNIKYIGSPVESYNSNTVNSAVSVEKSNVIRFSLSNSMLLNYNWENNLWSVDNTLLAIDALNHRDSYYYTNGTQLVRETNSGDVSPYVDNTVSFDMKFITSWIKLSGLTGYQRIYRATVQGVFIADHTITVNVFYDFDTTSSETVSIAATAGLYEYEFLVARQRSKAVKFEFIFTGDNANATVSSLELLLGFVGQKNRIATTKRLT